MAGLGVYGAGGITVLLNPNNNRTQNAIILIFGDPNNGTPTSGKPSYGEKGPFPKP